jgi:hypothetical protein
MVGPEGRPVRRRPEVGAFGPAFGEMALLHPIS